MKHLLLTTIAAVVLLATSAFADPIHDAVEKGNLIGVQAELDKGVDVNAKREDGSTPLHCAALKGHKEVAELLIDKGADVHAKGDDGKTPIDFATHPDNPNAAAEITDLFRKYGELALMPRLSFTRSPFGFTFNTIEGKTYRIESGMDLKKWNNLKEVKGTGNEVKFIDVRRIYFPQHFYRVKVAE